MLTSADVATTFREPEQRIVRCIQDNLPRVDGRYNQSGECLPISSPVNGETISLYKAVGSLFRNSTLTQITSDSIDSNDLYSFIDAVKSLAENEDVESGIAAIYGRVADMFITRQYEECNCLLSAVDVTTMDSDLLLSLVIATAPAPDGVLKERTSFFNRVRQRFVIELGGNDAAELLDRYA